MRKAKVAGLVEKAGKEKAKVPTETAKAKTKGKAGPAVHLSMLCVGRGSPVSSVLKIADVKIATVDCNSDAERPIQLYFSEERTKSMALHLHW